MDEQRWTAVDDYLGELLLPPEPALADALAASDAAGLPRIAGSPLQGALLRLLVRTTGAREVLEVGTLGGYSTIWLAGGLAPGGRVVTLEADPHHAAVARSTFARAGLAGVVELVEGPALGTLPRLEEQGRGPFDLVFVDADKPPSADYLRWALRLTRPGSLVVLDNVVRGGGVADPGSQDPAVRGVRGALELAAAEPRLEVTALQTVGAKGWDGLAVMRVRQPGAAAPPSPA